jgi:hypothetical protein
MLMEGKVMVKDYYYYRKWKKKKEKNNRAKMLNKEKFLELKKRKRKNV